eukprot:3578932-Prymnesium_polylepis.1
MSESLLSSTSTSISTVGMLTYCCSTSCGEKAMPAVAKLAHNNGQPSGESLGVGCMSCLRFSA